MIDKCVICGSDFYKGGPSVNKSTCSKDCQRKHKPTTCSGSKNPAYKSGLKTFNCDYCGSEYKVRKEKEIKLCSDYCRINYFAKKRIIPPREFICKECGTTFLHKGKKKVFCTMACQASFLSKNNVGKNNPNYIEDREQYKRNRQSSLRIRKMRLRGKTPITSAVVKRIFDKYKGYCHHCCQYIGNKFHIDHWYPISLGGDNSEDNLVLSCKKCNLSKKNRSPYKWISESVIKSGEYPIKTLKYNL